MPDKKEMPREHIETVYMHVRIGKEPHEDLRDHAKRLGMRLNDIVREAVLSKIAQLNEQLAHSENARRRLNELEKTRKAPGLGIRKKMGGPKGRLMPSDMPNSFLNWALKIESAFNDDDRRRKKEEVMGEIYLRSSTKEEATAFFSRLMEFVQVRADARDVEHQIVDIEDSEMEIAGDVDIED